MAGPFSEAQKLLESGALTEEDLQAILANPAAQRSGMEQELLAGPINPIVEENMVPMEQLQQQIAPGASQGGLTQPVFSETLMDPGPDMMVQQEQVLDELRKRRDANKSQLERLKSEQKLIDGALKVEEAQRELQTQLPE